MAADSEALLKYQRILQDNSRGGDDGFGLGIINDNEKITCASIDTNYIALGTDAGAIYLFSFSQDCNALKSFKIYDEPVNDIALDSSSSRGFITIAR
jgi:hypothetical protein